MDHYIVLNADGKIVNQIIWDGVIPYNVPEGCTLILESEAPPGLVYVEDNVTAQNQSDEPITFDH